MDDLNLLWKGVPMKTANKPLGTTVRAALLCAASDIPATRKLCGFLGHCARLGCSKCLKQFKGGFGEKKDYSGFNVKEWPKRSSIQHRLNAEMILSCKSKTAKQKMESTFGLRCSLIILIL